MEYVVYMLCNAVCEHVSIGAVAINYKTGNDNPLAFCKYRKADTADVVMLYMLHSITRFDP